jgi:transcriptional regulator with XRE-family HTH domain
VEQLESIRQKLGLSRRQICKLLKVDPSAWTRWMKTPTGAPPHVHQSLEWYMKLVEQNPEANAPYLLAQKFESSNKESELQISRLKKEVEFLRREHIDKKETFEQLGGKIQNSFENILLKFRDQMAPLKMLELDTLKYDNKKLASTIQDLESKMDILFKKLSEKTGKVPKKNLRKKISKKKSLKKVGKSKKPLKTKKPTSSKKKLAHRKSVKKRSR